MDKGTDGSFVATRRIVLCSWKLDGTRGSGVLWILVIKSGASYMNQNDLVMTISEQLHLIVAFLLCSKLLLV